MKLIFGLGNPEPDYSNTRHNIGKDVLNILIEKEYSFHVWTHNATFNAEMVKISNDVIFVKPAGFMNIVGKIVSKICNFYKVGHNDILIIYDELDLKISESKLTCNKGSKIHNGILSVKECLGGFDFWHLRVGVREESIPMSVQKAGKDPTKYVLEKIPSSDSEKLLNSILNSVIPQINSFLSKN